MTVKPHILVVGAGVGGLTATLALLRAGYDVDVYEQAGELREAGAGLQLAANGTRVLIALGLRAALQRVVCEAAGKELRLYGSGRSWKLFDLGMESVARYGAPYWFVHRGDLHQLLAEAVSATKPGCIHLDARGVGFVQDGNGVRLHLHDGRAVAGDALVGADGVHSQIRQALFGPSEAEFLGVVAWRGLVPTARLPERLRRPVGINWIGPGGHVVMYPLRRGQLLNFVGVIERENWGVESWTERGTIDDCIADFARWHEDVKIIARNIEVPYKWALLGREPLRRWSVGRVTLLGDACHPTLPFLAQGANAAIEDGVVLARCLDASASVEEAFTRYERARVERTGAIVRGSSDNARRFHNPVLTDPEQADAYIEREWAPDKIQQRYQWLFAYDALTVEV